MLDRDARRAPVHGQIVRGDALEAWLERTRAADPAVRRSAVQHLCPCHVKARLDRVWGRIFELAGDPAREVRAAVVHALSDGSPRALRGDVIATLESLEHDPDAKLRRQVRRLLAHHRRSGEINIG